MKILAIILCAATAFTAVGCGIENDGKDPSFREKPRIILTREN